MSSTMKISIVCRLVMLLAAAFISLASAFSQRVMTPEQVSQAGTRRYVGASREAAVEGCAVALATLGYEVTLKDPANGRVKTAPKTILVTAKGDGNSASATDDQPSWSKFADLWREIDDTMHVAPPPVASSATTP
jgi:hypothetical protein